MYIRRKRFPTGTPAGTSNMIFGDLATAGRSFFVRKKTQINNITTRSRTVKQEINRYVSAAQSGAAELRNAVRCSASWPIVGNFGTPVVQNSTLDHLRLRLRRVVSFSDIHTPCRPQFINDPMLHTKQQRSVGAFSLSRAFAFGEVFPMHDSLLKAGGIE